MTILEPILYANGTLRLTRHGRGKGGNILMHVPTNSQCEISDKGVEQIDEVVQNMKRVHSDRSAAMFTYMQHHFPER
jgi:hypothetical protein